VLVNGFLHNARVKTGRPQFVDSAGAPSAVGGTIRQTRLGLLVTDPDVLHAASRARWMSTSSAASSRPPAAAPSRSSAAPGRGHRRVAHAQLLFGRSRRSSRAEPALPRLRRFPDFAAAGTVAVVPQFRATLEQGYTLRLAEQVAVLAPTSGTAQGLQHPTRLGERSRRPYLQARVRLAWGPTDDPARSPSGSPGLARLGRHLFQSRAVTADARFKVGPSSSCGGVQREGAGGIGRRRIGQSIGPTGVEVPHQGAGVSSTSAPDGS